MNGVYAFSEESAWVVGDDNTIIHTSDGGSNWVSISDAAYDDH